MQQTSFSINYKRCIIDKLGKVHNPHRGPPSLPAPIAILEALSKNWNHQMPQNDKKYVFGKWQIKICLLITPILSIGRCYMSYILYFASLYTIFTCCQPRWGRFLLFWGDQLLVAIATTAKPSQTWLLLRQRQIIRDAAMTSQWRHDDVVTYLSNLFAITAFIWSENLSVGRISSIYNHIVLYDQCYAFNWK